MIFAASGGRFVTTTSAEPEDQVAVMSGNPVTSRTLTLRSLSRWMQGIVASVNGKAIQPGCSDGSSPTMKSSELSATSSPSGLRHQRHSRLPLPTAIRSVFVAAPERRRGGGRSG